MLFLTFRKVCCYTHVGDEGDTAKREEQMLRSVLSHPDARFLALAFVLLNVFDIAVTSCILQAGGYELNPLIRAALQFGLPAALAFKIGLSALFAWLLYRLRLEAALRFATVAIWGICLFNVTGLALYVVVGSFPSA